MVENPQHPVSPRAPGTSAAAGRADDAPARRAAAPVADATDPVTDWLLERDDLDAADFGILFGIHKLAARSGRGGWIGHAELCRSTGLGAGELGGRLNDLCRRGLLGRVRHPVKSGWARYLLIAPG